jgi:hypothetical protein
VPILGMVRRVYLSGSNLESKVGQVGTKARVNQVRIFR